MRLKDEILKALETAKDGFISGEWLASSFKVSRAAVSKAVASLKSDGYVIESKTNKGYKLVSSNVKSSKYGILKYLKSEGIDVRVIETTDSTNTQLKKDAEAGAAEGSVLVSECQTGGRGRTGKSFLSPSGTGVYMSMILRPKISAEDSLRITACAAVAVSEAIEEVSGKEVKIKWVNDIFCESKKICGILTEASLDIESGGLNYVILGIGVNVFAPEDGFGEYDDIAGALFSVSQNCSEIKNRLIASIIDRFMKYYSNILSKAYFYEYKRRSLVISQKIYVIKNGSYIPAIAEDIDDSFRLLVKYEDGSSEWLVSGEVSVKKANFS